MGFTTSISAGLQRQTRARFYAVSPNRLGAVSIDDCSVRTSAETWPSLPSRTQNMIRF